MTLLLAPPRLHPPARRDLRRPSRDLRRWKFEAGTFFEGFDQDASAEQLADIAPGFPVFRVAAAA